MDIWKNVIHNAMLGTSRLAPDKNLLAWPDSMPDYPTPPDAETQLLHLAAVAVAYSYGGTQPLQPAGVHTEVAAPEALPYCSNNAATLLTNIVQQDVPVLLVQWLQQCIQARQIAPPDLLPLLLQKGKEWKQYSAAVVSCTGNRGVWLAKCNTDWHYALSASEAAAPQDAPNSTVWLEGTTKERATLLTTVRNTTPATGRQMLMDTWAAENAATRTELLQTMSHGLSEDDLEWLETLTNEKSQKVRDVAYKLLKRLRGSVVNVLYHQFLNNAINLTTEKALLGLVKKTVLRITPGPYITESLLKTGIAKTAKDTLTEEEHVLWQVIASVHPNYWLQQYQLLASEVIAQFKKDAPQYLSALANAISTHRETGWALAFATAGEKYYNLIPLLPGAAQERLLLSAEMADVPWAKHTNSEWSEPLAMHILRLMAQMPYQYTRGELREYVHLIPVTMIGKATGLYTKNDYYQIVWTNTCTQLDSWLQLKKELKNAF